jgi:hypothetical protein
MCRRRSSLAVRAYHAIGLAALRPQPTDTVTLTFPYHRFLGPYRPALSLRRVGGSAANGCRAGQAAAPGLPTMVPSQMSEAARTLSRSSATGHEIPKTIAG